MGRSHATLDDQFNASWINCQQLEDIVDRIRAHMFDYLESMKALCVSGHAVADDFKSFYERSPERLTTISIKYEMIQNGFRTDKIALLSRLLNQNVFLKMEEFKVELAGLRSKVGDREVARKRYDHYHSKIQDLRDSRTKAKAKGKELSVSDLDKLTRNERKYEDARLEYVAINRLVARALWNTWARRFQILDPIYAEVIKIKANFAQALSNQLQIVLAPLKTQMTLELREEPLPAVFAPAGAPAQAASAKGNGAARSHFGEEDGTAGYDDGEYGVMSPGGTQEMDPRKLSAKMHAATEKLETDAALAQKKAQEKQLRANQKAGRNTQAGVAASIDLEQTEEHTDDDEEAEEAAARKAKAAKAKAKAAAAAAAISTSAPSAIPSSKRQPSAAKPVSPPTEDDDSDDIEDSDDDDEEARRKARKAAKKEQKRQAYKAQTAAAAAQAMANAAEARKAPKIDSNSLDFLADMVASTPVAAAAPIAQPKAAKASKAAKSSAPVDLLAFSPVKEASPASSMSLLDFATPASAAPEAAPAKKKGRALELDSFFGAAASTTSAAPGGASHPAETHAAPLDPFFNLPGAESAEPVDLLAVPPPKPQPHVPAQGVARAPSAPGGAGSTNALDDPFFAAPLPMPASITPKAPGAAGAAPGAAKAKPAAKPAAAKKKSKSTISSSEESSDSSDSESSDSEQEEGKPAPRKKAAPKAAASKAAASAAAAAGPAAGAGATSDPFDFVQNPTQSQREASTPAARSQQAADKAAAKAAEAVQSPKKPAAAAAPPSAAAAAAAAAKPPKPVVGRTPSGSLGLSDVYVPSAAAPPAPAPAAASAAGSKPKKSKQPDALSPGSASPGQRGDSESVSYATALCADILFVAVRCSCKAPLWPVPRTTLPRATTTRRSPTDRKSPLRMTRLRASTKIGKTGRTPARSSPSAFASHLRPSLPRLASCSFAFSLLAIVPHAPLVSPS